MANIQTIQFLAKNSRQNHTHIEAIDQLQRHNCLKKKKNRLSSQTTNESFVLGLNFEINGSKRKTKNIQKKQKRYCFGESFFGSNRFPNESGPIERKRNRKTIMIRFERISRKTRAKNNVQIVCVGCLESKLQMFISFACFLAQINENKLQLLG